MLIDFPTADIRNQMMMDKYINLVHQFCPDDFISSNTQDGMCIKCFHGKSGCYTGFKLWRKFEECRKEIRILYISKLPKDISSYPSIHSLRDVYKKFALEAYKAEYSVSDPSFCTCFLFIILIFLLFVTSWRLVSTMMILSCPKCRKTIG
jgi:hypothetical protein